MKELFQVSTQADKLVEEATAEIWKGRTGAKAWNYVILSTQEK
jgi:hypothetical protein